MKKKKKSCTLIHTKTKQVLLFKMHIKNKSCPQNRWYGPFSFEEKFVFNDSGWFLAVQLIAFVMNCKLKMSQKWEVENKEKSLAVRRV